MTITHTPGPWSTPSKSPSGAVDIWSAGTHIASVHSAKDLPVLVTAPELLKALKAMVENHPRRAPKSVRQCDEIAAALSLIAKAEGRA